MSEYTYELKQSFKYAKSGEQEDATFITITAPTFKQLDKVAPIKQALMAAISEIQDSKIVAESDAKTDNEKLTGAQCIQLMYTWSGDLNKVFLHAEQLFKSDVALIDGESRLTSPLMDKMSVTDFEGLVGAYIANFIAPSLMDGQ